MSVLSRFRQLAPTEFEMQGARVVKYTDQRCSTISKRYQKFFRPRLCKLASLAYYNAIMANECDSLTKTGRDERRKLMDSGIRAIVRMQVPLVVYWSLFETKDGGIREWVELLNREIVLMNGAAGFKSGERVLPMIRAFDMSYREDRQFINAVRKLHKHTYSKICSVPLEYKDHLSDQILTFVDNALFCVLEGNSNIPTTKKQYDIRDGYFKRAIHNLNGLQRPLYALWNVMEYSENTMNEWAELIDESLRLIQGVRKSDRQRFGNLK